MLISSVQRGGALVPALFTATIFLSASLLFFVQPLFAKIVLPQIGGAAAVWTTAMLFFQSMLIGGYLYAHLSTHWLPLRAQVALHGLLWAAALAFLPLGVDAAWRYDPAVPPALQTLSLFAAGVGLPFFVLSANAPLIQHWYGRSGGPSSDDPYFLYGASNLGSLLALLAFPLAAEPLFGAAGISLGWSAGFVALGAFLLASGLSARSGGPVQAVQVREAASLSLGRIGLWLGLAFVPSSLMLAVTTKAATDMGSIPLFWVVPLALYLLTFVLTFTNRPVLGPRARLAGFVVGLPFLAALFAGAIGGHLSFPLVSLMMLAFFAVSLFGHGLLYDRRPPGAQLTLFYVLLSVGGALGGFFNSILAPVLFNDHYEGAATVAVAALLVWVILRREAVTRSLVRATLSGLLLGLALGLPFWTAWGASRGTDLFRDRSFFGSHEVRDGGELRRYTNGTTLHGAQRLSDLDAPRPTPLTYYHQSGPIAQVLTSSRGAQARRVGVVGLGTGSLACYRRPGQEWHFYEIDAMVDVVARDPNLFTFMSSCAGDAPTHLGDARLVLAEQSDLRFDVLILDAYSSDAVPVHLTTTEAMELYLDRLAPDGLLVYHISNRYYDLHLPLARSAAALGVVAQRQFHSPGEAAADEGATPSHVVLVAKTAAALGELAEDPRWSPLPSDGGRPWTDDYANPFSILR